jgi:adenylate kinase
MAVYLVLLGAPGAGKGTQARMLGEKLGLPQVATGELFRHNMKNETELGILAKSYIDKGDLVPDDVTIAMVRNRLTQADCLEGAILDGFPRNLNQAEALDTMLAEQGHRVCAAPFIHVSQDDLVSRLLKRSEIEGRSDDNEETIRTRMNVYAEQTQPLLDYYREKGVLVQINGEQSIEAVSQALLEAVR